MLREDNPQPMRWIGARIRERRVANGLSQTDLAKRVGLTLQQIQKYETARSRIPVDRLLAIAEVLGTRVSYLADAEARESEPSLGGTSMNRQTMDLVRCFQDIGDGDVRRAILGLVRQLSGRDGDGGADGSA